MITCISIWSIAGIVQWTGSCWVDRARDPDASTDLQKVRTCRELLRKKTVELIAISGSQQGDRTTKNTRNSIKAITLWVQTLKRIEFSWKQSIFWIFWWGLERFVWFHWTPHAHRSFLNQVRGVRRIDWIAGRRRIFCSSDLRICKNPTVQDL